MLPSFVVHIIIVCINQVGKFNKFIALRFQIGDQVVKRLRSIFCAVMTEDDGTVTQMLMVAYGRNNGIYAVIFPVKAVNVRNRKRNFIKALKLDRKRKIK